MDDRGAIRAMLGGAAALLLLGLTACGEEVKGPSPAVAGEGAAGGDSLPVDPGIICRAQVTSEVAITGDGFSPVPIDVPRAPAIALPSVTLSHRLELDGAAADGAAVLFSGDPDVATNLELLSWQSQEQLTLTLNQAIELPDGTSGALPTGVYDVLVKNPNTREATLTGALAVVEKPALAAPSPGIVCLAEEARAITVSGAGLLEIGGTTGTLTVDGVEAPFEIAALGGCTDIAFEGASARYCDTATVEVPQAAIEPGYPALITRNPETAACHSEEAINLRVVPPPVIDEVEAPLACVAQGGRSIVIGGQGFLVIDGAQPTVTVGGITLPVDGAGGCEALPAMGHEVESCSALTVTLPEGALEPGTPEVAVVNPAPAGCGASNAVALTIVPPPTVTDVVPSLVCLEHGERVIEIRGADFLTVLGALPEIRFDDTIVPAAAVAVGECEAIAVDRLDVERCAKLTVTLAEALLPAGLPDVTVTNPDPAGCMAQESGLLAVVSGPTIVAAEPALVCTDDGSRAVTITGTDLLRVGDELPSVTANGVALTVDALGGCTPIPVDGLSASSCTTLEVTIPAGTLAAGDVALELSNPSPAGCTISDSVVITAPPSISLVAATPGALCDDTGPYTVTVAGEGFLVVGGERFAVSVAGAPVVPAEVSGCTPLDVNGIQASSCTGFSFELDTDAAAAGPVAISVQNPAPGGCALTADAILNVTLPPTVDAILPNHVCSSVATSLTITGTHFVATSSVSVGGVSADSVVLNSDTELVATFDAGFPPGTHDVTVDNGGSCSKTVPAGVAVDPTPVVFYVKPQVLYSGITISATVFTSGLAAAAAGVALVDELGVVTDITNFDSPDRPNRIVAEIPEGLAAGSYEVRVTSDLGCIGGLPGAVSVTDALALELDPNQPIDPAYASPTAPTAVTVFAESAGLGFEPGALVYLSPTSGGTATELGAVVVDPGNPLQLSGVIPGGLLAGLYDLIVVNPSGDVALAAGALTVTSAEPPVITAVEPVSLANGSDTAGTIFGTNFDTVSGVSSQLVCDDGSTHAVTVSSVTETSVSAVFPSSGLTAGIVCLVEITNNGEGASYRYSAISVRNPAQNLFPWTAAATEMMEGRRGLGLEAARPTATSRFLYAIGGDDGSLSSAKTSVEAAPSDVYGTLGTWALQRSTLPAPRTMGGTARIGSFLYLIAGHDGTSATNTVFRAEVLDPLAGPEVLDLDATLGDGTRGLGGGLWLYRVAATFPSSDARNPGGESLAGDPLNVLLPDQAGGIVLTLTWAEVTGASGYRVYRSPAAGATPNELELMAAITCGDQVCRCGADIECRHTDDGQTPTTAGQTPLPHGSLGIWHALPGSTLSTARSGHATAVVPNPNPAQPNQYYLYALGGTDADGNLLSSYEWARVTVESDGSQTVSPWTAGSRSIGSAKTAVGSWVLTNQVSSVVGDSVFLVVGTGIEAGAGGVTRYSTEVRSGSLAPASTTGDLSASAAGILDAENTMTNARGGSVCEVGAGYLYLFGGGQSAGTLAAEDYSGAVVAGPDVPTWTALGAGSLGTARIYAGSANESAFYYVAGGSTLADGTNATATVERTVQ